MKNLFYNVEIEINTNCNRMCSYCPNSINKTEKRDMKPEVFKRIIDELCKVSFTGRISFHFYNEPTLCNNLENFVEQAKKRLPRCKQVLYSNGDNLHKALFYSLLSKGVDLFVITNHNTLDNSVEHNFRKVYNELSKEEREFVVYLTNNDINITNRGGALPHHKELGSNNVPCYMMNSLIVIDIDGNVICCFEDYFKKMLMGNIMESDLMDIWNSEKYTCLRNELNKGNRCVSAVCKKCDNYTMQNEAIEYDYIL